MDSVFEQIFTLKRVFLKIAMVIVFLKVQRLIAVNLQNNNAHWSSKTSKLFCFSSFRTDSCLVCLIRFNNNQSNLFARGRTMTNIFMSGKNTQHFFFFYFLILKNTIELTVISYYVDIILFQMIQLSSSRSVYHQSQWS